MALIVGQDGFKAHLAVEPDTGIISDCAQRKAIGADDHEVAVGLRPLDGEDSSDRVFTDSAYGSGEFRVDPLPPASQPRAPAPAGQP